MSAILIEPLDQLHPEAQVQDRTTVLPQIGSFKHLVEPSASHIGMVPIPKGLGQLGTEQAVAKIVNRHDVFRLYMTRSGKERHFHIGARSTVLVLDTLDLSDAPVEAEFAMEVGTRLEPVLIHFAAGNALTKFLYCRAPAGLPDHLIVILDHVAFDNYALSVLYEDLDLVLSGRDSEMSKPTASFQDWANRIVAYLNSDDARQHCEALERLPWHENQRIPCDYPQGAPTQESLRMLEFDVPMDVTRGVMSATRKIGTGIPEAILSTLVLSLHRTYGLEDSPVVPEYKVNVRTGVFDDLDTSWTMAPFATGTFFPIPFRSTYTPIELLRTIQQTVRALPMNGKTCPWLHDHFKRNYIPKCGFSLNYLGRSSKQEHQPLTPATEGYVGTEGSEPGREDREDNTDTPSLLLRGPRYEFPDLVPNRRYLIRLHFIEEFVESPGYRQFDVLINGERVLTNWDVFQTAGAKGRAVVIDLPCDADESGKIEIDLQSYVQVYEAFINGIEVLEPALHECNHWLTPYDYDKFVPLHRINCGGESVGEFATDEYWHGGTASSNDVEIDISGVRSPAPPDVYRTDRRYDPPPKSLWIMIEVQSGIHDGLWWFRMYYSANNYASDSIERFRHHFTSVLAEISRSTAPPRN